jgi:protocatechuate 3,4-dioxygenase beta subunit
MATVRPAAMFRTLASLFLLSLPLQSQDREFLDALVAAQRARPAELTATARIAPATEPGTPLVVHGRAFAADGKTPLSGAIVFAYHTDSTGMYDRKGAPAHSWRLEGWAKTGADGVFEFHTIRPGRYPNGKVAAHIHLTIFTAEGAGYHAGGLLFDDDALVTDAEREQSRKDGIFGTVAHVRREGEAQHVDSNIRVVPGKKFMQAPAGGN